MSTYLAQKQTPLKLKGLRFDAPYLRMNEARLAAYSYLQIAERGHHSISALLMIAKIALLNGNETEAFEAYSAGIEEVAIASQVHLEKEVATVLGHGLVQFAKRNGGDITLLKEPGRGAKTGLHFEGRKVKLVLSRSQK